METLERLGREFVSDTRARGLSPNTTAHYTSAMDKFLEFARKQDAATLEGFTPRLVKLYAGECLSILAPGGAHARLRVLRAFAGYLVTEGVLEVSPFQRFKLPRVPDKALDVVRTDQYLSLASVAALGRYPLRDQAMLAIMFDTGVRAIELCGLYLDDVNRAEGGFVVRRGKGGKSRFVPASRPVLKRVSQYIAHERPDNREPHLFFTQARVPMNYDALRGMLERHCRTAGMKVMRPHAFRRGFAVAYVRNGGDVFTLQRILGHTTLAMSSRYARMNVSDVKDVHSRVSPVARSYTR
jgi:integrase/recombinase XerD